MADINQALAGTKASIDELNAAAAACRDVWDAPRAPGKWSPSQIVEHVSRAIEESTNVVSGAASKFPTLPAFIRPVARLLVFNRVVKKGTFPKGRTTRAFNPDRGAETPAQARQRLDSAFVNFADACRRRAEAGHIINSGIFGNVSVEDYVRFQELHTRHHCRQMPAPVEPAFVTSTR